MDEENEPTGMSYADYILEQWLEVSRLSMKIRKELLTNTAEGDDSDYDSETGRDYIATMTWLWLALSVEVEGRSEFKTPWREESDRGEETKKYIDLQSDFLSFRPYSANPCLFFQEKEGGNPDTNKLFLFEEILCKVIRKLKITKI
jgi:hypothetical protein